MEEQFVTLHCIDCGNVKCGICPIGTYIPEDSLRGCTRKVSEKTAEKFYHYTQEIIPFIHMNKSLDTSCRTHNEILNFMDTIYSSPLGRRLGKSGKALTD